MVNQSDTSNNFAVIFDGNNLKNWQMAGRGKFLVLQEEGALQSEGEWDCYDILGKYIIISYLS